MSYPIYPYMQYIQSSQKYLHVSFVAICIIWYFNTRDINITSCTYWSLTNAMCFFSPTASIKYVSYENGHVDTLKVLLSSNNFIKPYSEEHLLVHIITTAIWKCFLIILSYTCTCFICHIIFMYYLNVFSHNLVIYMYMFYLSHYIYELFECVFS